MVDAPGRDPARAARRRRFIAASAALALALYALVGFFLAPRLLARELVAIVRSALGRQLELGSVAINPFALSLDLQGARLHDLDGSELLRVDELYVNFEASSLFRRAFTFSEIRVRGPWVHLARDAQGAINLAQLVPPSRAKAPAPSGGVALPRLLVQHFQLVDGAFDFDDHSVATAFHTHAGPFALAVDEISTLPDATGEQVVKIALESGAQIAWTGSVSLAPLRVEGDIRASGPLLAIAHRYLRDQLRFDEAEGAVELRGHYRIEQLPSVGLSVALRDFGLRVADLRLSAKSEPDFLRWKALDVSGVRVRWPQAEAEVGAVRLDDLRVAARRDAQGAFDLAALLTPNRAPAAAPAEPAPAAAQHAPAAAEPDPSAPKTWKIRVGELALRRASAELTDATLMPPAPLSLAALDLSLRGISNEPGAKIGLDAQARLGGGGSLRAKGELGLLPAVRVDAELAADGVQLAQLQPYLSAVARIGIRSGALAFEGRLASNDAEPASFDGSVRVNDLDTHDLARNENLIAWSELGLDDVQLRVGGRSAQVSRIRLVKPFGRVYVARDKSTNLSGLWIEAPPAAGRAARARAEAGQRAPAPTAQKPFRVRIGSVLVQGGEADYTDLSLPLPFAARVRELSGQVTAIDTGSASPTKLAFEGKVDPYGLARVQGMLRTSAPTELADISVTFRNIEMPTLSPYAVEFAGRKIASGKISVDLRYRLHARQLEAQNKMVIDELELGDKVPSPNALDLPLGLAVALLRDANGRIDIDLPVSGSLDDPQFRIGPVIWKALATLITKIVTSPFRLLGGLLGVDSEDFGKVEFEAGRSDVLPPDREKLARVGEALGKRPSLNVEVPAVVDPEADAVVLRRARVDALVAQALAPGGSTRNLDKRTRRAVEDLYAHQFPERALDAQRARFTAVPPDDPKASPRLDEIAYLDDLRAQLAAAQQIADSDLAALAQARAEAVVAVLHESGALDAARVKIGERRSVEARDGEWVGAELGVSP